ncbi:MAG: TPM domain-containing protein [Oscillospiraceae bacterium]|nr:TPM domain-containing protein [Oscillospiraceae bacterium]
MMGGSGYVKGRTGAKARVAAAVKVALAAALAAALASAYAVPQGTASAYTVPQGSMRVAATATDAGASRTDGASAHPRPPARPVGSYVADAAGVLAASTVTQLELISATVSDMVGGLTIAYLTVGSTDGAALEGYGAFAGADWGFGASGGERGFLVILDVSAKDMMVEVGYGLEDTLTVGEARRVVDAQARAELADGRFDKAFTNVALELAERMEWVSGASVIAEIERRYAALGADGGGKGGGVGRYVFLGMVVVSVIFLYSRNRAMKRRRGLGKASEGPTAAMGRPARRSGRSVIMGEGADGRMAGAGGAESHRPTGQGAPMGPSSQAAPGAEDAQARGGDDDGPAAGKAAAPFKAVPGGHVTVRRPTPKMRGHFGGGGQGGGGG